MPASVPASGRQVELVAGDARATVVEVGAGLRELSVGGRPVVDGYALDEMAPSARGAHLIPWPNRIRWGLYTWEGATLQLAVNEHKFGNASHGTARWQSWTLAESDASSATWTLRLHPAPGYAFTLDLSVAYALAPDGLTVTTTATNAGAGPAPYAYGAHPYLMASPGAKVDGDSVRIPAATWLPVDATMVPVGRAPVSGSAYDVEGALGERSINTTFTDLRRDSDGMARTVLEAGDGQRTVTLWQDESFPYVLVYTADEVGQGRDRDAVAIEPMTSPPNAFSSGVDVVRLEPGETFRGTWGIAVA
ncbi:aldose 1-epimerase [Motilibacter peucedani]|uniref:Aldose 1-epimerase n=1 Tax=Motilibacter peucedani TaxID=598650 RepID=A0A420XRV3_9ACTN|nr:aldose 1-epimerase family protein [Motilibacter peucedani]RKS77539.1 aldose 1-epimerase [Motilibacter peucedani]